MVAGNGYVGRVVRQKEDSKNEHCAFIAPERVK